MTAIAWPLAERRLEISSQLDASPPWLNSDRARREPIDPSSGTRIPAGVVVRVAAADDVPFTGGAGGVKVTDPMSGIASPRAANGEVVSYGNGLATVVGASRSFLDRKSSHAARPAPSPKRRWNACRGSAELTSPPPLPKIPPISEAVAITSVAVKCCGTLPNAAYSPGSLVAALSGLTAMSMYALMPAMYSLASLTSCCPAAP